MLEYFINFPFILDTLLVIILIAQMLLFAYLIIRFPCTGDKSNG